MRLTRLALAALLSWSAAAAAQQYPAKPVRWIVPTGPGSAVDVTARRVAPKLGEALGQPVIVDNRPGANSMIAAREVARAPADGYTLLQAVVNNALNDLLTPDPCCVLNDKLVPVTRLVSTSLVMVVNPSVPANSVKEYVALAKAKPQMLTYASGGNGAITQMVGELFKLTTGIQVREIPYKAIGAELPDLTGGHVDTAYLASVVIRDHIKSGKLRGLAVAGREAREHRAGRSDDGRSRISRGSKRPAGTGSSCPRARRRPSCSASTRRPRRSCSRRRCRTRRSRSGRSSAASRRRRSPRSCAPRSRSGAR